METSTTKIIIVLHAQTTIEKEGDTIIDTQADTQRDTDTDTIIGNKRERVRAREREREASENGGTFVKSQKALDRTRRVHA